MRANNMWQRKKSKETLSMEHIEKEWCQQTSTLSIGVNTQTKDQTLNAEHIGSKGTNIV